MLRSRTVFAALAFLVTAAAGCSDPQKSAPSSSAVLAATEPAPAAPVVATGPSAVASRYRVPLGTMPFRGAPAAKVTIVEITDYQCPFCRRADETMKALLAAHPNDVRIQIMHAPLPIHDDATPAAEAAIAAAHAGHFWEMHDQLMASGGKVGIHELPAIARRAGVALEARDLEKYAPDVAHDVEAAKALAVVGTPTFFVNGRLVRGARSLDVFERIVGDEIAAADALIAKGTPVARVYDELTKNAPASVRADDDGEAADETGHCACKDHACAGAAAAHGD